MAESNGLGWARWIGFLTGLAIAGAAVLAWRIPPGSGTLGTDLVVAAVPSGEIQVTSPGPFITAPGMHPTTESGAPNGSMEIRNISAQTLAVRLKAAVNIADLDSLLWLELELDGERLFRGPVGRLERGDVDTFALASGERATIDVRTWLPSTVTTGYEARIANVDLTFEPVTGGSP
jgi:hypothetical protein